MKNETASLTAADGGDLVLRSMQASGRLEGMLLSMTLRQVFRNDQDRNLEVTYTFPLAWGAVLLGLEATVGGRRMAGRVMARREARGRYEEAVEKGDAPVMVEKSAAGVYCATLGSLKPGEEAVIELSYAQLLSFEQGQIRLILPTTLAPRYGDPVRQGGLQPEQAADPDLLAQHGFSLDIAVAGAAAAGRIGSPSHAISQRRENGEVVVTLQDRAWLDRDFVLLLEGLEGESFAIAGPDGRSGEGHTAVIASFCPALPPAGPEPLRLKLLVDCSGSMAGDSIAQARDALLQLSQRLTPQDQVSFSRFGDCPRRVLRPVPANGRNLEALVEAINETDADLGGTEMADALRDTFSLHMGAARHSEEADVLIVTDGEVWDARRIVDEARRSGHRIYALGVGSAPAESLLRELAEATGGACEFVTPNENMERAMQRLMARIRSTQAVRTELQVDGPTVWSSPLPRRLTGGETMHVYLRLVAPPGSAPTLQISGQTARATLTRREDDLVARLLAAREIGEITDTAQASDLAERYQLVTDDTSLLLVIERAGAERTDGMPALHAVRPMVAAGTHGIGTIQQSRSMRMLRRQAPPMQVLSTSRDNIPVDMQLSPAPKAPGAAAGNGSPNVPSVWRTRRVADMDKADALASGGLDDYEIPAFLRKQAEDELTLPSLGDVRRGLSRTVDRLFRRSAPSDGAGSAGVNAASSAAGAQSRSDRAAPRAEAGSAEIIAAFNAAAVQSRTFRAALRAVTDLTLDLALCRRIVQAAQSVGSPVSAWACYLFWLHAEGGPQTKLSAEALELVEDQMRKAPLRAIEKVLVEIRTGSQPSDAAVASNP